MLINPFSPREKVQSTGFDCNEFNYKILEVLKICEKCGLNKGKPPLFEGTNNFGLTFMAGFFFNT